MIEPWMVDQAAENLRRDTALAYLAEHPELTRARDRHAMILVVVALLVGFVAGWAATVGLS